MNQLPSDLSRRELLPPRPAPEEAAPRRSSRKEARKELDQAVYTLRLAFHRALARRSGKAAVQDAFLQRLLRSESDEGQVIAKLEGRRKAEARHLPERLIAPRTPLSRPATAADLEGGSQPRGRIRRFFGWLWN